MRKKTATQTPTHPQTSSAQQTGLIARAKTAKQSAVTKSPLDDHSHRTLIEGIAHKLQRRPTPARQELRLAPSSLAHKHNS